MKNILIIRKEKAYLPEADAYKKFFEKNGYNVKIINKINKKDLEWGEIIWHFMGLDINPFKYQKTHYIIHDYRSLSENFYKDKIRKTFNLKPNLRIFLSEFVKKGFLFEDDIKSIKLDMGVDEKFLLEKNIENYKKKYEFVYCGAINKFREIDKVLNWFVRNYEEDKKFLLIGEPEQCIYEEFKKYKNIEFIGKVLYEEVPNYLKKGNYAICNIPNIYPYNSQTPTKLLEYIALDLKIITNKTPWVKNFLLKYPKQKVLLYKDICNLKKGEIEIFDYNNIDIENYVWSKKIEKSKILEVLKEIE